MAQQLSPYVSSGGQGFASSDPRQKPMHRLSGHAVAGVLHIKWRKMGTDVSSGPGLLSKKEEDWQ